VPNYFLRYQAEYLPQGHTGEEAKNSDYHVGQAEIYGLMVFYEVAVGGIKSGQVDGILKEEQPAVHGGEQDKPYTQGLMPTLTARGTKNTRNILI